MLLPSGSIFLIVILLLILFKTVPPSLVAPRILPPIIGDIIKPPAKPETVSDKISSGLPSATALIAPSAAPDKEPSTIISTPYAANLPKDVLSVFSAPSSKIYSLPCFAKILAIVLLPACLTPCSTPSSIASFATVLATCSTPSSITSLPANFIACSKPSLAVLSTAFKPKAFATEVPAAPPKPFVNGPINPLTKPVAVSYNPSFNSYFLLFPIQSDALIATFKPAPTAPATSKLAPPVNGAAAAAPIATIPDTTSATISVHIF